jgi:hypothetical protein
MLPPPLEELMLVAFARKIGAGTVGEVCLRSPVHGMIAGVDPGHRRDRTELSDRGVGDLRVVHDIGIVAHLDVEQNGSRADLAVGAELAFAHRGRGIDRRFNGEHLGGHLRFHQHEVHTSSMGLMTMS